ncbi:hypothetical protein NB694_001825 [Pantoea ananatis]|nr:hypothetical protein [Pantoea ananatis]
MNRKQFIQSEGATCSNWTWSWSFVNHENDLPPSIRYKAQLVMSVGL